MKKSLLIFLSLFIIGSIVFALSLQNNSLKIGFVAGLSGKYSNLGHSVLDGFILAFDEIDYKVNNQKIQIDIKDDKQKPELAKARIRDFKNDKVDLIVGNTTSSMTKASLSVLSKYENLYLFSPTASSSEFSNKDDNFFRLQVAHSKDRFKLLSKYIIKSNLNNLYLIYDSKNKSYTNNYLYNLEDSLISLGGKKYVAVNSIDNGFENIVQNIKAMEKLDAIIIVANSLDTTKLIQYLRVNNIDTKIISSGWAKNKKFLEDGGRAVEGTIFLTSYDEASQKKDYLDFVKKFKKKYSYEPSVFSAQAYETGKIIIDILKKDSNLKNFKKNLLSIDSFKGLQGKITFNKYGDVQRDNFIVQVKDNKFVKIDFSLE